MSLAGLLQGPRGSKAQPVIVKEVKSIKHPKIKKFVVADVGGYGNKDLYQVSLGDKPSDGVFVLISASNSTKFH